MSSHTFDDPSCLFPQNVSLLIKYALHRPYSTCSLYSKCDRPRTPSRATFFLARIKQRMNDCACPSYHTRQEANLHCLYFATAFALVTRKAYLGLSGLERTIILNSETDTYRQVHSEFIIRTTVPLARRSIFVQDDCIECGSTLVRTDSPRKVTQKLFQYNNPSRGGNLVAP